MKVATKIAEAQRILRDLGLPAAQQNELSALTLLALCGIKPSDPWSLAQRESLTLTKGLMTFVDRHYGKQYAPNTRETFRRQVLHQFVQARIADYNPDNPDLPTNSPKAHYALTDEALAVIRRFGSRSWGKAADQFVREQGSLYRAYQMSRERHMVPLQLPNGVILTMSPGKHNELQAAIITEFGPRFAPGAHLLYLGDTAQKDLYVDHRHLQRLGIPISGHGKLPDVVLIDSTRNWLFLVEAVTSHGPMTPKRIIELNDLLADCPLGKVFVSAFLSDVDFRKYFKDLAWDTEVWLADKPDHMIHLNGDRFLGPRT